MSCRPVGRRIRSTPECDAEECRQSKGSRYASKCVKSLPHSRVRHGHEIEVEGDDTEFRKVDARVKEVIRGESDLYRMG